MSEQIESRLSDQIETLSRKINYCRKELAKRCDALSDMLARVKRSALDPENGLPLNSCGELQGNALSFDLLVKEIRMLEEAAEQLAWIRGDSPKQQ